MPLMTQAELTDKLETHHAFVKAKSSELVSYQFLALPKLLKVKDHNKFGVLYCRFSIFHPVPTVIRKLLIHNALC